MSEIPASPQSCWQLSWCQSSSLLPQIPHYCSPSSSQINPDVELQRAVRRGKGRWFGAEGGWFGGEGGRRTRMWLLPPQTMPRLGQAGKLFLTANPRGFCTKTQAQKDGTKRCDRRGCPAMTHHCPVAPSTSTGLSGRRSGGGHPCSQQRAELWREGCRALTYEDNEC